MLPEFAAVLALTGTPAPDPPGPCHTTACGHHLRARGLARHRWRAQRTMRHWRAVTRPYEAWLTKVAQCESGGDYRATSRDGAFHGGLQFTLSSWHAVGGRGYPENASPLEQRFRAVRLLRLQGRGAWPRCG